MAQMKLPNFSKTVLLLSVVSLFTDIASEMLYPVSPLFLKSIGFGMLLIGILEGVAEAIAGYSKGYFGELNANDFCHIEDSLWLIRNLKFNQGFTGFTN